MELNENDLIIYENFINQIDIYDDKKYNLYSNIINDFLKSNYNSSDNKNYELDDFIQESYALLYSDKTPVDRINEALKELYNNKSTNKEKSIKLNVKKYLEIIENPVEKEVLKTLVLDEDLNKKTKELNITTKEMKLIVKKIYNDLKENLKINKDIYIIEEKEDINKRK